MSSAAWCSRRTGSPTSDFYGGDRKGRTSMATRSSRWMATTGKLKWYQQLVHHDIWDYDLPAAPTLIDVMTRRADDSGGRADDEDEHAVHLRSRRPASRSSASRSGRCRRATCPARRRGRRSRSRSSRAPLARTTFDPATDFYTLTPEHAAYCRELWDKNQMYTNGMFTPAAVDRTMVTFPSTLGGGNWNGLAYDARRGLVFTNIMNLGQVARMQPPSAARPRLRARRRRGAGRSDDSGIPRRRFPARRRRSANSWRLTSTPAISPWKVPLGFCRGAEAARVRIDRHAEHRRPDRHRQRALVRRRQHRIAASVRSTRARVSCYGRRHSTPRPHRADHLPRRSSASPIRRHRRRRRQLPRSPPGRRSWRLRSRQSRRMRMRLPASRLLRMSRPCRMVRGARRCSGCAADATG